MRIADIDVELVRIDAECSQPSDDAAVIAARESSYEDAFMLRESTVDMFNNMFGQDDGASSSA